jgi:hypothetical protein
MASNVIANALKHPHPAVPFTQVGDDTITELAQLATIFKNKFQTYASTSQGRGKQTTSSIGMGKF